jgi:hypothetical protein
LNIIKASLLLILSLVLLAGCRGDNTETQEMTRDVDSELIREAGTDVSALDTNNDGTVYQCPMDYQVISGTMETCPICKMDLEEYSVEEAQQNLSLHYQQNQ